MTPADDLPTIPWTQYQWAYWTEMEMREHVRWYALAARAERDAEIERLKASVRDRAASECVQYERAEAAEAQAISGFYEGQYPHYVQGMPTTEVQSVTTAEECNGLVNTLKVAEARVRDWEALSAGMELAYDSLREE